ncbi:membrane dipeptidase [Streptomyces sp. NPDC058246]|uniref:membrane dipeptidase n=1 Tax=Streptomyces sp. NPDC058246 TaxID=3346400 RepID=UPI0036E56AAC
MTDTDIAADVVEQVLSSTPVFDGHNDLPVALRARSGYSIEGLADGRPDLHTDLPRLRAGGVGAQFWSVYVSSKLPEPDWRRSRGGQRPAPSGPRPWRSPRPRDS